MKPRKSGTAARKQPTRGKKAPAIRALRPGKALTFSDVGLQQLVDTTPRLNRRVSSLISEVAFSVGLKSRGGQRLSQQRGHLSELPRPASLDGQPAGRAVELDDLRPAVESWDRSEERLRQEGFTVVRRGRFGLSVRGPFDLVRQVTAARFYVASRPRYPQQRSIRMFADAPPEPAPDDLYLAPADSLTLDMRGRLAETIDDFVFIPPPLFFSPASAVPPARAYHSFDPGGLPALLNVPPGASALGSRVAVIDTGFQDHPYYQGLGVVIDTPGMNPRDDTYGHGTAIVANLLAVARDSSVSVYRQTEPPQDALEAAVDNGARILSCSWGWDHEQSFALLEATIRDLVAEGTIILFASGNGHHAWPGTMREVLSIGGVFSDDAGQLEASSYASGFISSLYPNPPRRVPDVSGLCGQGPRGIYIVLPCHPGCDMDRKYGGTDFPDRDGTGKTDGWVVASGTSSATPQVAGIVALMLKEATARGKRLDTDIVRRILEQTARPVTRGRNAFGFPATGHPNTACGYGLVDAAAAIAAVGQDDAPLARVPAGAYGEST